MSGPQDINKLIEVLALCKDLEQRLIKKLNQNKPITEDELPYLEEACFDLLIRRDHFDQAKILAKLEENQINVSEPEIFFTRLDGLVEIDDFNEFAIKATDIVNEQFEYFAGLEPEEQKTVIKILFAKNESYQTMMQHFYTLGSEDAQDVLGFVFNDKKSIIKESKEEFVQRVKQILFGFVKILKGKKLDDKLFGKKADEVSAELYDQR